MTYEKKLKRARLGIVEVLKQTDDVEVSINALALCTAAAIAYIKKEGQAEILRQFTNVVRAELPRYNKLKDAFMNNQTLS